MGRKQRLNKDLSLLVVSKIKIDPKWKRTIRKKE